VDFAVFAIPFGIRLPILRHHGKEREAKRENEKNK
jgi:hypothetical protein